MTDKLKGGDTMGEKKAAPTKARNSKGAPHKTGKGGASHGRIGPRHG